MPKLKVTPKWQLPETIEAVREYYVSAGDDPIYPQQLALDLEIPVWAVYHIASNLGVAKRSRIKKLIKYEVDEKGCWNWLTNLDDKGYGKITINNRRTRAHIYYYEQKYGEVPEGLELDHLCRNKRCCNPDHLEAVTGIVNVRRGNNTKYPQELIEHIREEFKRGKSYRDIAYENQMKYFTVWKYINDLTKRRNITMQESKSKEKELEHG